jgi:ubiquinone/menaquinone biosynthesis C-methylase UbiE
LPSLKTYLSAVAARHHRCPSAAIGLLIGEQMVRQHGPETRWTISLLHIAPNDQVLEIGCGAGRGLELVVPLLPEVQVTGIDLSAAMVRRARRRNGPALKTGHVSVRQGDVARLPFPERRFDNIFSIHSLYFWTDPEKAVQELSRVIKSGGRLAITVSPGKVGEPSDPGFLRRMEDEVLPEMERAGFTQVRVETGPDSGQYRTIALTGLQRDML